MSRRARPFVIAFIMVMSAPHLTVGGDGALDLDARAANIAADVVFRQELHFRADRDYVSWLYDHPEQTTGSRAGGALFTPDELGEVMVRAALEDDAAAIERAFSSRGSQFGGWYIDHQAGGKLVVLTRGGDAESIALGVPIEHRDRLIVRPADFSYAQLEIAYRELSDAWLEKADGTKDIADIAIDTRVNRVVVGIVPSGEGVPDDQDPAVQTFRSVYPGAIFEPRPASPPMNAMLNLQCDPNAPPVYGGSGIDRVPDSNCDTICTMGFEVQRSAFPGVDWILTAGHCFIPFPTGLAIYHRTVKIGTVHVNVWGGKVDFGLIRSLVTASSIAKTYYSVTGVKLPVGGRNTTYGLGSIRCWTGSKSNATHCGLINNPSWSGTVEGVASTDFVQMTGSAIKGDSGSPIYPEPTTKVYANGVLSGSGGGYIVYPKISNVPSAWGVTISTS